MKHTCLLLLVAALASCASSPETAAPKALAVTGGTTTKTKTKTEAAAPAKPVAAAGSYKTIIGDVNGIVCAFCVQGIQKRFESIGKADQVVISLEQKKVVVTEKPGKVITDADFRQTIKEAGFEVGAIKRSPLPLSSIKRRLAHQETLVAQASAAPAAMVASH